MKTITKLAASNIRQNRTRSILIALSIFLSTSLLTVIAEFGYGLVSHGKSTSEEKVMEPVCASTFIVELLKADCSAPIISVRMPTIFCNSCFVVVNSCLAFSISK